MFKNLFKDFEDKMILGSAIVIPSFLILSLLTLLFYAMPYIMIVVIGCLIATYLIGHIFYSISSK